MVTGAVAVSTTAALPTGTVKDPPPLMDETKPEFVAAICAKIDCNRTAGSVVVTSVTSGPLFGLLVTGIPDEPPATVAMMKPRLYSPNVNQARKDDATVNCNPNKF
jgi:hypothetical protein